MRKRKRAKVVWLPPALTDRLGTAPAVANNGGQSAAGIATLTGPGLSAPAATQEFPLVKDFANAGDGTALILTDLTLADIEESGYRLRRVVGKIYVSALQDAVAVGPTLFLVTAGMIIRRVNDGGQAVANVGTNAQVNIATSNMANASDPWIWRRSWIVGNLASPADPNVSVFAGSNSAFYGAGTYDGPHCDAKTARIVGPEERLFLDVSVEGLNGNAQDEPGAILLVWDLRILASMRTNVGNRRNASR